MLKSMVNSKKEIINKKYFKIWKISIDKLKNNRYNKSCAWENNAYGQVVEWLMAPDCKSGRESVRWFESISAHH